MLAFKMVAHPPSFLAQSTSFAMSAGLSRLAIQLRQFHSSDVTRTSSLGAMQRATVAGWLNFQSTWVVPLDASNAS